MKMRWSIRLRWPWVNRRRLPAKVVETIARRVVDEMLDDAAKELAKDGWMCFNDRRGVIYLPAPGWLIQVWGPGWRMPITLVFERYTSFYANLYWRLTGTGKMQAEDGLDKVEA